MNQTKEETAVLDPEKLEKSWDESIAALRSFLGGDGDAKEDLEKAKKEEEEEGDEEEEEEEEEEELPFPRAKKSLPDIVAEDDEDAEAAMDVSPFLKSLVEGLQAYVDDRIEALHKALIGKLGEVGDLSKALARTFLASAEMQKSIRDVVFKIGKQPLPIQSVLRKSGEKFPEGGAAGGDSVNYDKRLVLQKSFELLKKGEIDIIMATKIEGRVTRGLPLPEEIAPKLLEGGKS